MNHRGVLLIDDTDPPRLGKAEFVVPAALEAGFEGGVIHPSQGSLRKRVIASGVAGLAIAGIGLALAEIGGWGPCGPSGPIAYLGGLLSIYHAMCLCMVFPTVEKLLMDLDSVAVNIAFFLLVPAGNWFLVTFGLLTLRARLRSRRL
jgi:hypothetical protein